MPSTIIHTQLARGLNSLQCKMHSGLLGTLADEFSRQQRKKAKVVRAQEKTARRQFGSKAATAPDRRGERQRLERELFEFLTLTVEQQLDRLKNLQRRQEEFRHLFAAAPSERERRRILLEYARDLGSSPHQLRADARAMDRWFGDDALNDRYARRKGETEQKLVFCLDRLGNSAAASLKGVDAKDIGAAWDRLGLEKVVRSTMQYHGDRRVWAAGMRCMNRSLDALPNDTAESVIGQWTLSFAERTALDDQCEVLVQCEAMRLLRRIAPGQLDKVLEVRLRQAATDDNLFVHRCCVELLGQRVKQRPELIEQIAIAAKNRSPFVRQQLARTVVLLPHDAAVYWLHHLSREDQDPKVRAAALVTALDSELQENLTTVYPELITKVLNAETDEFVLRTALHVASQYLPRLLQGNRDSDTATTQVAEMVEYYRTSLLPAIRRLQVTAELVAVRRWAAQAAEQIWVQLDAEAFQLLSVLRTRLAGLRTGGSRWISRRALHGCSDALLGRVLAVMAQSDYGYDAQRSWWGYRLTRGPVFRIRLWRVLHELLTPAPDKRQAFRHTVGRVSEANIRAPSQVLAELSETKVPGEPLLISEEGSWRPYLPLPDDFLSALRFPLGSARPVHFYTSEGVTAVSPPANPIQGLLGYLRLTWGFARLARLRNWQESASVNPRAYLERFQQMGFKIEFRPHRYGGDFKSAPDSSVTRFFPVACPILLGVAFPLRQYLLDFVDYFGSLFQNSVLQLLVFITAFLSVFLLNHLYVNWRLRKSRKALGLTIGGWGTRGKSGTERLKAALFNAIGCGVVSKSSGCEAMFMVSAPFGELRELSLHRPADKASIWEHREVMQLAERMNTSVFLWECMGLTPAYVEVLQHQWSCDDLSTITNAYPDHEDIQGPAGWNVADVISRFVPRCARLLTSERQMLPKLRDACEEKNSSLRSVGWLEAGLLTDDVLQRFPYKEHPDNIALVLALAEELGCERDLALKEMADRLVPDLGVLKTYPVAHVKSRRLEFTNGMSANERFGCLQNWKRMGFDQHDHVAEPNVWITTVVNNRADRVPRSRVFAELLVYDLTADSHFLIGSNLKGLQGYIWSAFDLMLENQSLWSDAGEQKELPAAILKRAANRYRQPTDTLHVKASLQSMLEGVMEECDDELAGDFDVDSVTALWQDSDAVERELTRSGVPRSLIASIVQHLISKVQALREYTALADKIRDCGPTKQPALDQAFHDLLRTWFERKLIVISDEQASGDEIVDMICEATPPGFLNRIMGVQNIKGTGMDFVHRWQYWDKCFHACNLLEQTKPAIAQQGLTMLSETQELGLLCAERLQTALAKVKTAPLTQSEQFQAELDAVLSKAEYLSMGAPDSAKKPTRLDTLTQVCSQWLDQFSEFSNVVRNRKTADKIYRDLVQERISIERAVLELRKLSKRQKSGGLLSKLRSTKAPWSPRSAVQPTTENRDIVPDSPSVEPSIRKS